MTKPGPKPKPTAIRVFEGNPGNLPLNEHEPKPEVDESLEYVDWLKDDCEYMALDKFPLKAVARMVWDEMAPQLQALGVLTVVDRGKFARYCESFARWLKVKAFIDQHGETYPIYVNVFEPVHITSGDGSVTQEKNTDGTIKYLPRKQLKQMRKFPQVDLYVRLSDTLRRYEEEFGIGAASRTRIQTILAHPLKKDDDHDFDYAGKAPRLQAVK